MTELVGLKVTSIAAPLRRQVAENIRAAILAGRFAPGARLLERELCAMTGVSRTAVREALRQLESEGLIENIAHHGPIVARITRADAINIHEMRSAIEGLLGRLFASRATAQQIRQLGAVVARLERACAGGEIARILRLESEFYARLADGAGNAIAQTVLRTIHARATFLRSLALARPERQAAIGREMRRVMTAIERRDLAEIERAMREHVEKAAEAALRVVDEAPLAVPAGLGQPAG